MMFASLPGSARKVRLTINGESVERSIEPRTLLLDFLRDDLGLTGARRGCESGYCGACTVLLDAQVVHSCSLLAVTCANREVQTIEGLAGPAELDRLQEAFIAAGAIQCGYCTPGMILAAKALLAENARPSEADIRAALAGNLCRCTGYVKIIAAIQAVAARANRAADAVPAAGEGGQ
jgi:carbon-monoxide dehydrogenase small subunit